MQRLRLPRITRYCKTVSLATEFENKVLTNQSKHKILDSIAKDWGEINFRSTVYNNNGILIKSYSCAGHGGYLVLTDTPLENWSTCYSSDSFTVEIPVDFYVYEFEEDCAWSMLVASAPPEIQAALEQDWNDQFDNPPEEPLAAVAERTFQRWYAEKDKPQVVFPD